MNEENNASEETEKQQLPDAELQEVIKDAEELAEAQRKLAIEKLRALPAQKILTPKQHETLLSIKEEELTEKDKTRIAWATLRLTHHRYTGTDYSPTEKKNVKAKRRQSNKSRKANR